jgi:hypothetical protein
MDRHEKEFARLLDKSGAVFLRKRRHVIYRLPSGSNVVCSATPSSWRASRQRVSDLKRILRDQTNASVVSEEPYLQPPTSASMRAQIHQSNVEARPQAEVHIPTLGRPAAERDAEQPVQQFFIESVSDLVDAAEMTESWRNLDVRGRTRVLTKIASRVSQFANVMVASVRYGVASEKELDILKDMPWFAPVRRTISEPVQAAYNRVSRRSSEWQPALVIDDPYNGKILLEVGSNELLESREKIFVAELPAGSNNDYFVITRNTTSTNQVTRNHPWGHDFRGDETERKLLYMVLLPTAAKTFQVHAESSSNGLKPLTTREVVQDVLDTFQLICLQKHSPSTLKGVVCEFAQFLAAITPAIVKGVFSRLQSHSH